MKTPDYDGGCLLHCRLENATKTETVEKFMLKAPFESTSVVKLNSQWLYVRQSTRYSEHRKFRFPCPRSPKFMMQGTFHHELANFLLASRLV